MLQILSTSNETATGPELVTNGDFSATGSELVTSWTNSDFTSFTSSGSDITQMVSSAAAENCYSAATFTSGKSYKLQFTSSQALSASDCQVRISPNIHLTAAQLVFTELSLGLNEVYFVADSNYSYIGLRSVSAFSDTQISNFTVKELGEDWTTTTTLDGGIEFNAQGLKITNGALYGQAKVTQPSIFENGKSYNFSYTIVEYNGGDIGLDGEPLAMSRVVGDHVDYLTRSGDTVNLVIGKANENTDVIVTNISVKLLGTYSDQSIYVTAADVQTIPQASVYYLVELTSMASKNSIYFLPSSVVANNGRYTKLNFTVVSKDATPIPASGIISFYDSVGGFDTYPMGFYEFRIYEQTSSTNLDPLLATGLLEKGFAFVRDFSGNMQELTDGFNEYNPTLTQYVYSQ